MQRLNFAYATMVALSLSAAGIGGATGCSVITNTTAIQCRSDNDCQAIGPEFYGFACDIPTHTCAKVAEDADRCVATPGKSANASCMEKFNGDSAICSPKSHRCVRLKTPECPVIVERTGLGEGGASDLLNDNTVVLGLIDGLNCCLGLGNPVHDFAQLALEQVLQGNTGGIPISGAPSRPIALLVCPEGQPGRVAAVGRAADHLANTVEVPLVVGPFLYDDINLVASAGLRDKRIPMILPWALSRSDVQGLPNPAAPTPLLYDIHPSAAEFVEMYTQLIVKQLEPRIRKSVSGDIKVAMITEKSLSFRESEELFEKKLRFNDGKSVEQNGDNYLKVAFADTTDTLKNPNPKTEINAALDMVKKFKPHIVIHNVNAMLPPSVMLPLIYDMGPDPAQQFKPYHLDASGVAFGFPDTIKIINAAEYPKGRVFAWGPHRDDADLKRATKAFGEVRERFGGADPMVKGSVVEMPINQSYYDSVYFAAYLIGAVGNKPLTAENFAAAVPRLTAKGVDSQLIKVGLEDSAKGFGAIAAGKSIDLNGITSTLDVDPVTGAVSFDRIEAWCVESSGKPLPSGFYSDPVAGSAGDITKCE